MAEAIAVVGLIGSIISVIDGIHKSRAQWKQHVHSSASLRLELLPILGKLSAFVGILRGLQLQYELDEADAERLRTFERIEEPLKASEQAVHLISARLDQTISLGRFSFTFGKILNNETRTALHVLDQAKTVLDLALAADQITLAKSIETYVRNVAEDIRNFRLEGKLSFHDLKAQLNNIEAKTTEDSEVQNKARVLAWISQTNYVSNYDAARQPSQRADTSGNWFLTSDDVQGWITGGKHSRYLLTAGSGKTVICAKTIEYLAQRNAASARKPMIFYFFFDFNDAAKQSVEGLIRALLAQLLLQMTAIPPDIQVLYDKQSEPIATKPSVQAWVNLLSKHLKSVQDIFIFIDALDECAEESYLNEILKGMFSGLSARWLLTCRPNERLRHELVGLGFEHKCMDSDMVDKDIETYLTTTLKTNSKFSSFSNDAKQCIITEITSKSSGMFRYAQCQLDAIAKLRDRRMKNVKTVLLEMPRTIAESYERVLTDARQLDDWPILERILLLASFSTRPTTVAEISDFAVFEDDMTNIDAEDRLDISDILTAINSMVTVRDGFVTLAHKSVQDFFAEGSERWNISQLWQDADIRIAKKCLQYLGILEEPVSSMPDIQSTKEPNTTRLRKLLEQYPFLDYAATSWLRHLPEKDQQLEVLGHLASTLPLTVKPNLWKAWLLLQRADIWENQIQLAIILSESFIRGALVTNWSLNFWQQRQGYRARSDTNPPKPATRLLAGVNKEPQPVSTLALPQSFFWVKATTAQSLTYGPSQLLKFQAGDRILIRETGPMWEGVFNGQTGEVNPYNVERCETYSNDRLNGQLFHELAILLLEVAFQAPLAADAIGRWTRILSAVELSHYLADLEVLIRRAEGKMGLVYADVIKYCLSYVYWIDRSSPATLVDVTESQETCMVKVHAPLTAIRATGFRASRKPFRRRFYASNHSWQTSHGNYVSSTDSAPGFYQTTPLSFDHYHTSSLDARTMNSAPIASYNQHSNTVATVSYGTSCMTNSSALFSHAHSQALATNASPESGTVASRTVASAMDAIPEDITKENGVPSFKTILQYDHLTTNSINIDHLSWESPNLIYTIFSDRQKRPQEIQPSDDEMQQILNMGRESAIESKDWQIKLAWASDVLTQAAVIDFNNERTAKALSVQISYKYPAICQDAVAIVNQLADRESPHAIYLRAKWWEVGIFGYPMNKVKSLEQYQLAAEKGHVAALYKAAVLLKTSGDLIQSGHYEMRAIDAGFAGALFDTASKNIKWSDGDVEKLQTGTQLILKAAEVADQEAPEALYYAGLVFAHEVDLIKFSLLPDYVRAVECFRKAALYGSVEAQFRLGNAYELCELGLPYSLPLALHYYIIAARRGEPEAEMCVSRIIMSVRDSDSSRFLDDAVYTYAKRAALDGIVTALFALGYFYQTGLHVEVDKDKALQWYEKAAARGDYDAKKRIVELTQANMASLDNVPGTLPQADDSYEVDGASTASHDTSPSK